MERIDSAYSFMFAYFALCYKTFIQMHHQQPHIATLVECNGASLKGS